MTLNEVIFIERFPKLDLHGYDRETAKLAINDYIKDSLKMKQSIFVVVHGNGAGILRQATHEALKHHKQVIEYKLYNYNNGCTIVRITI